MACPVTVWPASSSRSRMAWPLGVGLLGAGVADRQDEAGDRVRGLGPVFLVAHARIIGGPGSTVRAWSGSPRDLVRLAG